MKRISAIVLSVFLLLAAGCGGGGNSSENENKRQNLLMDPHYNTGFEVSPPGEPVFDDLIEEGFQAFPVKGKIDYNKTATGNPLWSVAQHSSAYSLVDPEYKTPTVENGVYAYRDPAKAIIVDREKGDVTLEIDGAKEYSSDDDNDGIRDGVNLKPRTGSEPWVHLLLLSTLFPIVTFGELKSLEFEIDMTLNKCVNVLEERGMGNLFLQNAHTAQLTMYFVVTSNSAADQGQFFWYGLSLFDARYESMEPSVMFDRGTSAWMVGSGTEVTVGGPVEIGKKIEVRFDMKDELERGLRAVQEQGALMGTEPEDLYVCDFNLGWELPGIYDVSVTFGNFGVYAERK